MVIDIFLKLTHCVHCFMCYMGLA